MVDSRFELGDKVKDAITGMTGICVGITRYLNGCERLLIQPQELKDGVPVDMCNVDAPQCEILEKKKVKEVQRTGGPSGRMPASRVRL